MKKILLFLLTITALSLYTGYNCRTNEGDPDKPDYKTRHAVACECKCIDRDGYCPDCGHEQEAQPLTIIEPTNTSLNSDKDSNDSFILTPKAFEFYIKNLSRVKPRTIISQSPLKME